MTITQDVHGHEVLALVEQAQPALTLDGLRALVRTRWGAQASFCTCSAQAMSLETLLTFLLEHGKIVERGGQLATDRTRICDHG
jgi:probable metal-binding protein